LVPVWVILAALALALAWPVPIALARAHWPSRAPGLALLLWQGIALAGGLSMIGAAMSYGLTSFGNSLPRAAQTLSGNLFSGPLPADVGFTQIAALAAALFLGLHLLLNLLTTAVRTERQRRHHHTLVTLLSEPVPDHPGTRVLDHPAPVAYCLPGVRTVTVLSEGLIRLLDAGQLEAVLAHERTHLRQFHHLVLLAFKAWRGALPWFPIANRAEQAVALLVEMLADDEARREVDGPTLAGAIALVGTSWSADGTAGDFETAPATDATAVGARISRLLTPKPALAGRQRLLVGFSTIALVAVPATLMLQML
jgi:Zn-dependent protease with chaperone function